MYNRYKREITPLNPISSRSRRYAAHCLDQCMVTVSFDSWQHRQGGHQSYYVQRCEKFVNCFKKELCSVVHRLVLID